VLKSGAKGLAMHATQGRRHANAMEAKLLEDTKQLEEFLYVHRNKSKSPVQFPLMPVQMKLV
jgi:hypothetical protein